MSPALKYSVDLRLTAPICQELDRINREDWRGTVIAHQKQILEKVAQLSHQMNLRKYDRSPEEEQISSRRHQENLILSPREQDKFRAAVYGEDL